jgi:hypothetical protein
VVKKDTVSYFGAGVNFDTRKRTRDVRNKPTQPFKAMGPAGMRHSVEYDRMQTGVAGNDFPSGASSGVALKNALDIGSDSRKHKA